jgi:insulin-like growth factor-binding protein complex acid labile subunit
LNPPPLRSTVPAEQQIRPHIATREAYIIRRKGTAKRKHTQPGFAYSISQEALPARSAEQLENITYSGAWRQKETARLEEQTYGYSPIMIVQIVLVIVTAVQVNSQLCPSVCYCFSDWASCKNLFSDVTNVTQETFDSPKRNLKVTGSTRLELEEDLFLRWNITSLTTLDLSYNNITKIWQRAFYSLADLEVLSLGGNRITTLDSQTFYNNTHLIWLSLSRNSIADIHPSTFQENIKLQNIFVDFNTITSLHPELFEKNLELVEVNLKGNRITDIHPSTFRNNKGLGNVNLSKNKIISIDPETFSQNVKLNYMNLKNNSITAVHPSTFWNNLLLISLDISRNKITSLNPYTFIHNKNLTYLSLQGNNITEISKSLFRGLEKLELLDLSNNNIGDLDPIVFQNTLTGTNRQNYQVSELRRLNLAQNMIWSLNFELYFPMGSNSDTYTPTFRLDYLNLSSNRLTTLDVASVKWLNQTTAVTDLTANPWNCDFAFCNLRFPPCNEHVS